MAGSVVQGSKSDDCDSSELKIDFSLETMQFMVMVKLLLWKHQIC